MALRNHTRRFKFIAFIALAGLSLCALNAAIDPLKVSDDSVSDDSEPEVRARAQQARHAAPQNTPPHGVADGPWTRTANPVMSLDEEKLVQEIRSNHGGAGASAPVLASGENKNANRRALRNLWLLQAETPQDGDQHVEQSVRETFDAWSVGSSLLDIDCRTKVCLIHLDVSKRATMRQLADMAAATQASGEIEMGAKSNDQHVISYYVLKEELLR